MNKLNKIFLLMNNNKLKKNYQNNHPIQVQKVQAIATMIKKIIITMIIIVLMK